MSSEAFQLDGGRSLADLSAIDLVASIDRGLLAEETVSAYYMARCRRRQELVGAWAYLGSADDDASRYRRRGRPRPLRGVPIAVKDLSDTADMPTGYGCALYEGYRPAADAACVAMARAAGATVLGKSATVEFGATRPCRTRNPRNLSHTPGGSSSGSAAAVADGQALLATGTQTGGSIIRPAAFCGIVGFKPSFGALSTAGTRGYSWSLDTIGVFARDVPDAELFYRVLRGETAAEPGSFYPAAPLKVARFVGPFDARAEPYLHRRLDRIESMLAAGGCVLERIEAAPSFANTLDWQRTISRYEMGRSLAYEWHSWGEQLSEELRAEIAEGMTVPHATYELAKAEGTTLAREMAPILGRFDAVLTYATLGEAPQGLASTGDATFNRSWSLLGFPCISLPAGVGPLGLPVAVQLVGAPQSDSRLLSAARRVEQIIGRSPMGKENRRINPS